MDIDEGQQQLTSTPQSPRNITTLHPTNTLAGPSTIPDQPALPPIFLPPPPGYSPSRSYFNSTQDLLARFQLSAAYDKYVRPYSLPVETAQASTPGVLDKGKGKEKEIPVFNTASPAADTPGAGGDGEEEDNQGKLGKKWKNNYKHLIKGIPGKHITKKDDYLMTTMQVPPKQRITIRPFDLRTQRDAFSVSLEGISKWNVSQLIGDSPQAKEEKRRKKELRKLAKAHGGLPLGVGTPGPSGPPATPTSAAAVGTPSAWGQHAAPVRTGTPRPVPSTARPPIPPPGQAANTSRPQEHVPPGAGAPRSVSNASHPPLAAQVQHTPATPAPTPGAGAPAEPRRIPKREREDSAIPQTDGAGPGGVTVNTNGAIKPALVLNAKAGTGSVRPRPVKKQRMDMQGHAREMPVQQPTPHA